VGICGYHSTGSSALCSLLHELDEIQMLDEREFDIIRLPDGLQDLDYSLNRFQHYETATVAIKRFKKAISDSTFGKNLISNKQKAMLTEQFINNVVQIRWNGDAPTNKIKEIFRRKYRNVLSKLSRRSMHFEVLIIIYKLLFNDSREFSMFPDNFLKHAQNYVNQLLLAIGQDENKITILNKCFHAYDPVACFKYFDSPKAIVVNRDPRDLYIHTYKDGQRRAKELIPLQDINSFIEYYKRSRMSIPNFNTRDDVLFINFESLVYDYENTVNLLIDFVGASSNHVKKGEKFNIGLAKSYTQLFLNHKDFEDDIKKIEQELPEFLFPFEKYTNIEIAGGPSIN